MAVFVPANILPYPAFKNSLSPVPGKNNILIQPYREIRLGLVLAKNC